MLLRRSGKQVDPAPGTDEYGAWGVPTYPRPGIYLKGPGGDWGSSEGLLALAPGFGRGRGLR